jgi:putative toxin-antitoxin system antitoxin component (TIGR02293 family)
MVTFRGFGRDIPNKKQSPKEGKIVIDEGSSGWEGLLNRVEDIAWRLRAKAYAWAKITRKVWADFRCRFISVESTPDQAASDMTDKQHRVARITKLAEKVFGDPEKAQRWLSKPKRSLGGKTPLMCLATETGEQTVENMLYQIDSGTVS